MPVSQPAGELAQGCVVARAAGAELVVVGAGGWGGGQCAEGLLIERIGKVTVACSDRDARASRMTVAVIGPANRQARTPVSTGRFLFSILMGPSRAYLGAHWLSDAAAGILLGTSCALLTASAVSHHRRPGRRQQRLAGSQGPVGVSPPDRAEARGRSWPSPMTSAAVHQGHWRGSP